MAKSETLSDVLDTAAKEVQHFNTPKANKTGGLTMTREDRKSKNTMSYPASVLTWLNEVTDSIYDDFESRTCANCKYLKELGLDGKDTGRCIGEEPNAIVDIDFGCNKFERTI